MSISYQRQLTAVFGDPVEDNPTVVMEQAAFDAEEIPMDYLTIQVKQGDIAAAITGMRAMNFTGANITMPHKGEVLKYLDQVSDVAKIMAEHPQMFLVIDKGNDYAKMLAECPYPERMVVEVTNYGQYVSARYAGFKYVALGSKLDKEAIEKLHIKMIVTGNDLNPEEPFIKKFLAEGGLAMIAGIDHARDIPPRLQSIPALFYVDWK